MPSLPGPSRWSTEMEQRDAIADRWFVMSAVLPFCLLVHGMIQLFGG
jgi:hypothetical protein